jgi:hypothetical protein
LGVEACSLLGALFVTAALLGCDQGVPAKIESVGSVKLVGANVGPERPLPLGGAIELAFDRFLLPVSVSRQSFIVKRVDGQVAVLPVVTYDPVARVVTLSAQTGSPWLEAGQSYMIELPLPDFDAGVPSSQVGGVRGIDGTTLDPSSQRVIGFSVSATPTTQAPAPTTNFCRDVLPIFEHKCSSGSCHGEATERSRPAAGLVLTTASGVALTAVRRVAQASNTGPRAQAAPPTVWFGVDMPLINPGAPGDSWLLYKMLLALPPATTPVTRRSKCDGTPGAVPVSTSELYSVAFTPTVSAEERARLGEVVGGHPMPYPPKPGAPEDAAVSDPLTEAPLSFGQLERVRLWIAQGAALEDCGPCEP